MPQIIFTYLVKSYFQNSFSRRTLQADLTKSSGVRRCTRPYVLLLNTSLIFFRIFDRKIVTHLQKFCDKCKRRIHLGEIQWRFYCPKNLTFPRAEREQQCPRLVVVGFCLFISILEFDWFTPANDKSDWQIEKNKQKITTTKRGHCCTCSASGKVRFLGH